MVKEISINFTRDGHEYNTLEIEARYSKGGINYFSGQNEGRGIYIHVSPFFVKYERGFQSKSCMLFAKNGGFKMLVTPLNRLSTKKVNETQTKIDALDGTEIASLFMACDTPNPALAQMLKKACTL